jgi:nitrate/nitrite transport system substrate-binding protein
MAILLGLMMHKKTLNIGFIPLIDALPLIAAQELGLFNQHGLQVNLQAEVSWSNIRDKLNIGLFDAAHMLAPMLFASTLGLSGVKNHLVTAYSFGLNGNAITLSSQLYTSLQQSYAAKSSADAAQALAEVLNKRHAKGLGPLTFATVFPFSCHLYQLKDWMASADIPIEKTIKICILPPEQMVAHLRNKLIDGFSVGEPWNTQAVTESIGNIITTGVEVWDDAPEKVLAVPNKWAKFNEDEHAALVCALTQASEWVEYNRQDALNMLIRANIVQSTKEVLEKSLLQGIESGLDNILINAEKVHIFHRNDANIPQQKHALFLLDTMQKYGQINQAIDKSLVAESCYKTEWHNHFTAKESLNILK